MTEERSANRIRYGRDAIEFSRALGFFDATFAIAATLLVTTLDPGTHGWANWSNLMDAVGSQLLAFAISFVVIAAYWWANHQFMGSLHSLSPRLIVGTIALLGFVVLLPFTTNGLGDSVNEVTTVVYAVNVVLVSATEWVLFRIALVDDLFMTTPTPIEVSTSTVAQLAPPMVFAVSIPVALAGAHDTARYVWLALLVVGPLVGRWTARRTATARAEGRPPE